MADIQPQLNGPGSRRPKESLLVILNRKLADIHAHPDKERRWGFGVISAVGVSAVLLGMLQISSDIRSPFIVAESDSSSVAEETASIDAQLDDLRNKDTDKDGLDDYSELYIYGTSPYLQDSDSDNISDKDEIDAESDPNCPSGTTCRARTITASDSEAIVPSGDGDNETAGLSPEQLRKSLIASGAPQSVIDGLTDDELIDLYRQTVAATGEDPINATETNNGAADEFFSDLGPEEDDLPSNTDDIFNLTADDLRALLIETGVDKASLDTIDDATLMRIYQESISDNATAR